MFNHDQRIAFLFLVQQRPLVVAKVQTYKTTKAHNDFPGQELT